MSTSTATDYPPLDPTTMAVARTLRAIRAADGEPEHQGEDDMEDAMALVRVMQEASGPSQHSSDANARTGRNDPGCAARCMTRALSPVWPPLLRMTEQERQEFEQLLALVATARRTPRRVAGRELGP
jgi:hypothetical protein